MPNPEDDTRIRLTNYFKSCPSCGRKVHISKRYPETKAWHCLGCDKIVTIAEMPDVPEIEARRIGGIIDKTTTEG